MSKCDYCNHVEMCGWRKDVEEQGCEFFDDGNKWIPCSERLPEEDKDVLAWVESTHDARVACCNYAKGVWFDAIMDVVVKPIAWMPPPEPYMKGIDDEEVDVL